jgi:hypothetical protein
MQLSYGSQFDAAMAGMLAYGDESGVASGHALEDLGYGVAVFRAQSTTKTRSVRTVKRNAPVQVWSGDFVTSNVINGVVNGVALDPITFATSHLVTVTALADAIVAELLDQGIVATYALSGSNRTITFAVVDASVLFANFVVTAGAGQVTVTLTHGTSDTLATFEGITRQSTQPARASDGLNGYAAGDAVAIVKRGTVWVPISSDVADNAAPYIDTVSGSEGKLTDVTTSPNIALTRASFDGAATASGLGLAKLEINLP